MPEKQLINQKSIEEGSDLPDVQPVRKSIRVRTSPERAFHVFTQEMDTWWPKTHHIGSSPMKNIVVEGWAGGTIYTDQEVGTACPWGSVLAWEPPHRFIMAWRVNPGWKFEADFSRCSEVELRFTPTDDGTVLVELEHRGFERHGGNYVAMREQVDAEGGWNGLLARFAIKAEEAV
jgi:hypothetical protein